MQADAVRLSREVVMLKSKAMRAETLATVFERELLKMGKEPDYAYKPDTRPSLTVQRAIDVEAQSLDADAICNSASVVYDGPDVGGKMLPRAPEEQRKHRTSPSLRRSRGAPGTKRP